MIRYLLGLAAAAVRGLAARQPRTDLDQAWRDLRAMLPDHTRDWSRR